MRAAGVESRCKRRQRGIRRHTFRAENRRSAGADVPRVAHASGCRVHTRVNAWDQKHGFAGERLLKRAVVTAFTRETFIDLLNRSLVEVRWAARKPPASEPPSKSAALPKRSARFSVLRSRSGERMG